MTALTTTDSIDAKLQFPKSQPIATARKDNLWSDGQHRHGKRIVAYEQRSRHIVTCHWWETDIGRGGSNFLDDGDNAVFPSKWIDLEPPRR